MFWGHRLKPPKERQRRTFRARLDKALETVARVLEAGSRIYIEYSIDHGLQGSLVAFRVPGTLEL